MNALPYGHRGHGRSNGHGKSKSAGNGADGGAPAAAALSAADEKPGHTGSRRGDGGGSKGRGGGDKGGSSKTYPGQESRPDRTDEQLLEDYRHGDSSSFGELVGRYQRELYHFLVRFLGNRASAEDVFQETFLQVHQSAEQFDLQRRFRPWLFTIAANKARDLIRSQARRPTSPLQATISPGDDESGEFIDLMQSAADMPGDPMEQQELQQQVHHTVTGMPEHLREILLLSYFHQFPYKQISEILDIPLGTVKSRLHAAVAHFADRWRAGNPDRDPNPQRTPGVAS